jgi:hypothetical protein
LKRKWVTTVSLLLSHFFERGAWFNGKKGQTWEAFNFWRRSSTWGPC